MGDRRGPNHGRCGDRRDAGARRRIRHRSAGGTLSGDIPATSSWTKTSEYTHHMGAGVAGATASAFLDQPGAEYVKAWVEAATGYQTLVAEDTLVVGSGFNRALPQGTYVYTFDGEAVTASHLDLHGQFEQRVLAGWDLKSNPLTGLWTSRPAPRPVPAAWGRPINGWTALQTWAVQVGGLGQFGQAGILAPGEAFWTIADSAFDMTFTAQLWWTGSIGRTSNGPEAARR